ncbi:MAG: hypothetical protein MI892_12550, partial [Desulfobacterales bacterium]|nr:hypothetical protein [Desulfobacterales bacterium]
RYHHGYHPNNYQLDAQLEILDSFHAPSLEIRDAARNTASRFDIRTGLGSYPVESIKSIA